MPRVRADLHTHTTYSDGYDMAEMVEAAAEVGLSAVGLTDHCIPYADPFGRSDRTDFDETYDGRREDIGALSERLDADVDILDGAEVNYDPNHERAVREFLAAANFEYTIGSVHYAGEYSIADPHQLADASAATKREAGETYVDWQVRLGESELFDIVGHLDLPQRSPVLRNVMDEDQYRRLADALAGSRTVPEINAGRLDREYGHVHPHSDYLHVFREAGVGFVIGTDSHAPDRLRERTRRLEPLLDAEDVAIIDGRNVT